MKQWEYKSAFGLSFHDIKELGLQGWELCGILPEPGMFGGFAYTYYFKRELVILPIAIQARSN